MNLSETAFLHSEEGAYRLRWFTPSVEVELCGHATLASAHVLWSEGLIRREEPARFLTASGRLAAEWRDGLIELDFPCRPVRSGPPVAGLAETLGCEPEWVGVTEHQILALFASEETVRTLTPDFPRLAGLPRRGTIVTAPASEPDLDFVSRYFAPAIGIDEDPVTGSAHCVLGPFWGERLGKNELRAKQLSPRQGMLRIRLRGERVQLGGTAVTVARGELLI
jgi:predicted PhzF superfamily epimerase YddE/YHI9